MCRFMATADEVSSYNAPRWWELHCFAFPPNSLWHGPGCPIIGSEAWINMESSSSDSLNGFYKERVALLLKNRGWPKRTVVFSDSFNAHGRREKQALKNKKLASQLCNISAQKWCLSSQLSKIRLEKHPRNAWTQTCTANRAHLTKVNQS